MRLIHTNTAVYIRAVESEVPSSDSCNFDYPTPTPTPTPGRL